MPAIWTQCFPPSPHFTEKNLKSQYGKVFVVTGGATGLGFELVSMLYCLDATVYIAGRAKNKGDKAIDQLKSSFPKSKGSLRFIFLDLSDLTTVQPAVEELQSYESRIDVLWNNAGIGADIGDDAISAQGLELHYATNCVGPLLFTRLLQNQLKAPLGRVIWTGSMTIDYDAPLGGVDLTKLDETKGNGAKLYACSKAGNWLIAGELAKEKSNTTHLVINPGNLKTPIWRYVNWFFVQVLNLTMLYPAKMGAYTAMWAGLSEDVLPEDSGRYIIPWGRWHPEPREDILASFKSKEEGGSGVARQFVEWCESKYRPFEGKAKL